MAGRATSCGLIMNEFEEIDGKGGQVRRKEGSGERWASKKERRFGGKE
jgi:hypothetical protein